MNIGPVSNSNSLATLLQLNSTTGAGTASPTTSTGAAAQTQVSPLGELMSKLQQLQQQDPAQFKQVAGQLATSLQQAAQQSGNGNSGFLSQLASGLQQAAQTGEMPTLQPPNATSNQSASGQAVHHHGSGHHHHSGGAMSSAVTSAFSTALNQINAALGEGTSTTATTT
jgi:hypothetical protein